MAGDGPAGRGGWEGCEAREEGAWGRGRTGSRAGCPAGGQGGRGAGSGRGGRGRGVPSSYPFQHLLQVVSELHEQVDLPAGIAVHRVDLGKHAETHEAGQAPRPPAPRSRRGLRPRAGEGRPAQRPLMSIGRGCLPPTRAPRPQPSCPGMAALWAGECGQTLGDRKGVREAHPGPPAVDRTRGSNPVGRECIDTPPLQRQPNETTN